ncbi:MAG: AAA family ATPase, partial [Candidatus Dormibacteraeota bacterium]|nr:AAA family ATPase [Candidatus Dormibacteraeota bacterium]MBO0761826.1 AAA family ATPase [Candidatus Dormibacteraeota bacterium]
MVEWRDEVLAVLDAWLEARGATGGDGGSSTGRRPRRVGEARFAGEGGCYTVDLRGTPLAERGLEGLAHLTLRGGAELVEYQVLRAHEANGLVHVQVGRHVTEPRLYLWAVRRPPAASLEAARRSLAQLEQPGLAGRLARGELDAPPEAPDGPASLDPGGQRQAFASCFTPGVFLVWGPPGTGKTEVLSQAVEQLVEEGSRVLLVAPFGTAVDSALQRILQRSGSAPGSPLRVGPPQLAELAERRDVCLDERAAWACGSAETGRRELETELLRMPGRLDRARELEAQLAGHDAAAYAGASVLVRREEERTRLFVQELELRDRLGAAARDEHAEAARLAALRQRWEDTVQHPLEAGEAQRLQLATDEAASAWAAAAAAARSCQAELEQVTARLEELSVGPRPSEAQRSLVHAAEAQGLPDLQEELEGLRRQIERDRERRPVLEAEHEERARELERRREE